MQGLEVGGLVTFQEITCLLLIFTHIDICAVIR